MRVKRLPFAVTLALAGLTGVSSGAAHGATDQDVAQIREQLQQMKEVYERRIDALEQRLAQAEKTAVKAESAATSATREAENARQASQRPSQEGAFNPAVSLILDGKFSRTSRDPGSYRLQGFAPNGGEIAPPSRSFSLGESELALSANIDHLFRGNARFSIADEGGSSTISTEEANIETLGLGAGFKIKAGRFLSGVGYLNQQHPHEWDFVDAPLAYKAFFGSALRNDGVQAKWVAPTELYLEVGAEAARGGAYPDGSRNKNGTGLGTLFAHLGGELGDSHAWQAGLSFVKTNPGGRSYEDLDSTGATVANAFSGTSKTWIADGVWKWAPHGDSSRQSLKLQGEYFRRTESGDLTSASLAGNCAGACSGNYDSTQSGWYAQGVYQFMPQWRVGLRYDRLDSGSVGIGLVDAGILAPTDFASLAAYRPQRTSVMVDWSPSEFSRLRLQWARDTSRGNGEGDNQLFLQYIMSLGAHGAHKF